MKIFHAADLHYCPKHLSHVDVAFTKAVDSAISNKCDLAVIAGDSFDSSMGIHEPAFDAYLRQVLRLSNEMPLIILQGTLSHDRLGALDSVRTACMLSDHPVWIADMPDGVGLYKSKNGLVFDREDLDNGNLAAVVCALPSLNKADPIIMEIGAKKWVERTLNRWVRPNILAREIGIPTILVTHGTVVGSITESNFAMVSQDHEFTQNVLRSAEFDVVLLGHIHKHQVWKDRTPSGAPCAIAYPGSIAHLVHGHADLAGFIIWDIDRNGQEPHYKFIPIPGRNMIDITFEGLPDIEELTIQAESIEADDEVRIRWEVDEDKAHLVDKDEIRKLFSHAAKVKLEGTVLPVQRIRSKDIACAPDLPEKIRLWAETTGDRDQVPALCERLDKLLCTNVDVIIDKEGETS